MLACFLRDENRVAIRKSIWMTIKMSTRSRMRYYTADAWFACRLIETWGWWAICKVATYLLRVHYRVESVGWGWLIRKCSIVAVHSTRRESSVLMCNRVWRLNTRSECNVALEQLAIMAAIIYYEFLEAKCALEFGQFCWSVCLSVPMLAELKCNSSSWQYDVGCL